MIFDAFFTKSAGCWVYNPEEEKFIKGKKSHGYGIIKYPEGSIYYGDIYYDGEFFNKLGKGGWAKSAPPCAAEQLRSGN